MVDLWQEHCYCTVRAVLADRGWKLVDWTVLADTISRELSESHPPDNFIERSTVRHYSRILHSACSERGSPRQQCAFQELRSYLGRISLYKMHDTVLAEELAQEAQVKIWKNLSRCKDPDRFMGFAQLILVNVIRDYYRTVYKRDQNSDSNYFQVEITESEMLRSGSKDRNEALDREHNDSIDRGLANLFADKTKQAWLAILERCIQNCQQRTVLIELFFENKAYKEISESLGIPVGTVYVYRKRALETLRHCPSFKRFFDEKLSGQE